MKRFFVILFATLFISAPMTTSVSHWQETEISKEIPQDNLWSALKSGNHLILLRHALAPGFSDPQNFDVNDCKTQRNLNDKGRGQSRDIGALFRSNGIRNALVYSSQWCRCIETAQLLGIGEVAKLPALNSFFEHLDRKTLQTASVTEWIEKAPLKVPTVMVTHQVNITALTGYSPASGEMVFVRQEPDGRSSVVGTIRTLE
jgi:phosphohistidine phosphatase SixA